MKLLTRASIGAVVLAFIFGLSWYTRAATALDLGDADDFAILANTTITNVGTTVINGDLGLSPGTAVTGFPPGVVNGEQHITDATAALAKIALSDAYDDAESQTPDATITGGTLGGLTLVPGVYNEAAAIDLTGTLTLDAQGDADAVWIFQAGSTLTTAASSSVVLINGAQACNVYWQVGSSATLGANTDFKGNILARTSATLITGAEVEGRVLAQDGAITLGTNVVTRATCIVPPPPPPPPPDPDPEPDPIPPLINIVKIPDPLVLPAGGGSVTYGYTVSNIGTVPINNVVVTDNTCSDVAFVSGDTNSDSILDVAETWTYTCTDSITQTTTNTGTATGDANGFTTIDTSNATVVVGVDVPPPLLNLVKTPSWFLRPGSDTIIYTYDVTNLGTVPAANVSLVDDTCTVVTGPSGDANADELLDPSETWTYSCTMTIAQTTVNTATAQAGAGGLTAVDFAVVTVAVVPDEPATEPAVPGLPEAGLVSVDKRPVQPTQVVL